MLRYFTWWVKQVKAFFSCSGDSESKCYLFSILSSQEGSSPVCSALNTVWYPLKHSFSSCLQNSLMQMGKFYHGDCSLKRTSQSLLLKELLLFLSAETLHCQGILQSLSHIKALNQLVKALVLHQYCRALSTQSYAEQLSNCHLNVCWSVIFKDLQAFFQ